MVVRNEEEEARFNAWIQAGELRPAAQWLVQRYADEVIGLCTAMVRDRTLAEDLAQDAFGRAFTGLASFRGEASSRTWLLRIVKNRCIDQLRAARRDPWAGQGGEGEDPDAQPDEAPLPCDLLDRRDEVQAALSELNEGERALVVLRFRNGLDYSELAMAFGLREGAVRMRVSRALARLRAALEQRDEDEMVLMQAMELEEAAPASLAAPRSASMPEPPAAAAPPAPARARALAGGAPSAPSRRPGALRRVLGRMLGSPPPSPPDFPLEHPLTAYFAATREALSESLLQRLQQAARTLG